MINTMVKTVLENITIADILEAINKKYGDKPALRIYTEDSSFRQISYAKLGGKVVSVSSALINLGIQKNDRVAILSENRPEWAVAYFGIISAAGIVVPIDGKLTDNEVQFILNDSGAKCIFVSAKHLPMIEGLRNVLPSLEHVILLDASERDDIVHLKKLKPHRGKDRIRAVYPEDTALIVYTSGTTGVAKGVEVSYKNLLFQVLAFSRIIHCSTKDRLLSVLPLNHMLEITGGLIVPLYAGACVTYCNSLKRSTLLPLMKKNRTTAMICVPLILKMIHSGLMKKIGKLPRSKQKIFKALLSFSRFLLKYDIRVGKLLFRPVHREFGARFRGFISGGAPLDIDVEIDLNAMGFRILQGYGLTETAPVISVNTYTESKLGSVGVPLPDIEVKIVEEVSGSGRGEIITRGPHVMKGYFKNPEKTAETIREGWLHTGDIGYLDDDGFLYVCGRIKNLIALGSGKKVFPEEVEAVIGRSPYVKEIFVTGRTATQGLRRGHEEVFALVVPNLDSFPADEKSDDRKIREKLGSEILRLGKALAEYKRIMDFQVRYEELPKTLTKKIKRKELSDMLTTACFG